MTTSKTLPETTHTPAPWTAWDDDGTGTLPCVLAQQVTAYGNFYVAQCNVYADAKLIATAPELYTMLRGLLDTARAVDAQNRTVDGTAGFAPELFAKCQALLDRVGVA